MVYIRIIFEPVLRFTLPSHTFYFFMHLVSYPVTGISNILNPNSHNTIYIHSTSHISYFHVAHPAAHFHMSIPTYYVQCLPNHIPHPLSNIYQTIFHPTLRVFFSISRILHPICFFQLKLPIPSNLFPISHILEHRMYQTNAAKYIFKRERCISATICPQRYVRLYTF